jgi:orotate phosphoribosyltransferase-like protein
MRICQALVQVGLARDAPPLLKRVKPVYKSATARTQDRPRPQTHYQSLGFDPAPLLDLERVLVVDDVVTRGAMLLASVSRVAEACPGVPVQAFGLVRTVSNVEEFEAVLHPVTGLIRLVGEETQRRP